MTEKNNIWGFSQEINCIYKEELYSVRDNGSVLKHPQAGKRPRPTDNKWTFGKPNDKTGYMEITNVRVHRIVATAFLGDPPSKEHVVDHIDTNKRNNRPENLRWVTRLENVLLNPITIKRIEFACGCSVEEFLADPPKFRDKFQEPNYSWMCTVSKQEGQNTLERLLAWTKSDKIPSGGSLGQWIYNRSMWIQQAISDVPDFTESLTPNAVQRDWELPCEFPCCPQESTDPLNDYAKNLNEGLLFCSNNVYSGRVIKSAISVDQHSLIVMTSSSSSIKPWALAKITYEDGLFVHESCGTFFQEVGAEKYYCIELGLEWTGGETFDDNC